MIGFKIRDPATGNLRLDLADYTVKVVFETNLTISGAGAYSVPGISEEGYGAFLFPLQVDKWRTADREPNGNGGEWFNRSMMPKIFITANTVNWDVGFSYQTKDWRLVVVKYI